VDKTIGRELLLGRAPLQGVVLLVSGRASFEILQKAAVAGIALVCAVSAPSSLAIDLALRLGMTLVGFLRPGRLNVYGDQGRVLA
jgi:FdhD protein